MRRLCLLSVVLAMHLALYGGGDISSPIVGFTKIGGGAILLDDVGDPSHSSRVGAFRISLADCNDLERLRLAQIRPNTEEENVRLEYFDGNEWQCIVSRYIEDATVRWFDERTDECVDDRLIPVDQIMFYELPPGVTSLGVAGIIPSIEDFTASPIEMDDEWWDNLIKQVEEIEPSVVKTTTTITTNIVSSAGNEGEIDISGIGPPVTTNYVVITNVVKQIPRHFLISKENGQQIHAYLRESIGKICDAKTGMEIDLEGEKFVFDVDYDAPEELRAPSWMVQIFYDATAEKRRCVPGERSLLEKGWAKLVQTGIDVIFDNCVRWLFGLISCVVVASFGWKKFKGKAKKKKTKRSKRR